MLYIGCSGIPYSCQEKLWNNQDRVIHYSASSTLREKIIILVHIDAVCLNILKYKIFLLNCIADRMEPIGKYLSHTTTRCRVFVPALNLLLSKWLPKHPASTSSDLSKGSSRP